MIVAVNLAFAQNDSVIWPLPMLFESNSIKLVALCNQALNLSPHDESEHSSFGKPNAVAAGFPCCRDITHCSDWPCHPSNRYKLYHVSSPFYASIYFRRWLDHVFDMLTAMSHPTDAQEKASVEGCSYPPRWISKGNEIKYNGAVVELICLFSLQPD